MPDNSIEHRIAALRREIRHHDHLYYTKDRPAISTPNMTGSFENWSIWKPRTPI